MHAATYRSGFMRLIVPAPSVLDAATDEDLLLAVAAGDLDERDPAAAAFFRRYAKLLYGFCLEFQNTLGGEVGVSDLVLRTFERAFDRAGTYDSSGIKDREHSLARTFSWLTTIAERILKDWLKSPNEANPIPLSNVGISSDGGPLHGSVVDIDEQSLTTDGDGEVDASPSAFTSPEQRLLREALDTLTEREREIVLLTARFLVLGKQLRIDEEDLDELCRRWQTTPINVRAIRSRAFRKIRAYVCSHTAS